MKDILVGYSGFVGSNLALKHKFFELYNSKNILEAYGSSPDLLIYSGVPSGMFLANNFPKKDLDIIYNAQENIKKINPKKVVLISTIAVYDNPINVNENTLIDIDKLTAYGANRYILEQFIEQNFSDYLIVRLPALFGKNLKKNFIYDFINLIPKLLDEKKYNELVNKDDFIKDFYFKQDNGYFKCIDLTLDDKKNLKEYFLKVGFTALNFTDSRSVYQFYNLDNLWAHIEKAFSLGIKKLNLATEPIQIQELYKELTGKSFVNELNKPPFNYNYKTLYFNEFKGNRGYIFSKTEIINQIKGFIKNEL